MRRSFGDVMILDVQGNVIQPLNRSAKRLNSGCEGKGSDGVYCIRASGLPKRTDHDTRLVRVCPNVIFLHLPTDHSGSICMQQYSGLHQKCSYMKLIYDSTRRISHPIAALLGGSFVCFFECVNQLSCSVPLCRCK
jgi:hypothetical protein